MALVSDFNDFQTEQEKLSSPILNHPIDQRAYQGLIQPKGFPSLPEDWVSEWETFPSADGRLQLFGIVHHRKVWEKGHRALMVFHGLGEHGGRYLHFPHFVGKAVDAVYCTDHRGHGRSEGLRGHVDRFDQFADDAALSIARFEENLTRRFGQAEIHLLGHSMGGLIVLRTLLKHPSLRIASATISAPLLGIRVQVPVHKKLAGRILSKTWSSVHMTSDLDPRELSHDLAVVEAYKVDRLVHKKVTPRFFTELENTMDDTLGRESGWNVPLQFQIPLQDKIVNADLALKFFRDLKLRDKVLKTYPDLFHEPFNEIGKELVFEDLCQWIKNHSVSSSP